MINFECNDTSMAYKFNYFNKILFINVYYTTHPIKNKNKKKRQIPSKFLVRNQKLNYKRVKRRLILVCIQFYAKVPVKIINTKKNYTNNHKITNHKKSKKDYTDKFKQLRDNPKATCRLRNKNMANNPTPNYDPLKLNIGNTLTKDKHLMLMS